MVGDPGRRRSGGRRGNQCISRHAVKFRVMAGAGVGHDTGRPTERGVASWAPSLLRRGLGVGGAAVGVRIGAGHQFAVPLVRYDRQHQVFRICWLIGAPTLMSFVGLVVGTPWVASSTQLTAWMGQPSIWKLEFGWGWMKAAPAAAAPLLPLIVPLKSARPGGGA